MCPEQKIKCSPQGALHNKSHLWTLQPYGAVRPVQLIFLKKEYQAMICCTWSSVSVAPTVMHRTWCPSVSVDVGARTSPTVSDLGTFTGSTWTKSYFSELRSAGFDFLVIAWRTSSKIGEGGNWNFSSEARDHTQSDGSIQHAPSGAKVNLIPALICQYYLPRTKCKLEFARCSVLGQASSKLRKALLITWKHLGAPEMCFVLQCCMPLILILKLGPVRRVYSTSRNKY